MWGGAIKIGARPFWGRGVFVLVISNVNIGFQKSLTPPLRHNQLFARILAKKLILTTFICIFPLKRTEHTEWSCYSCLLALWCFKIRHSPVLTPEHLSRWPQEIGQTILSSLAAIVILHQVKFCIFFLPFHAKLPLVFLSLPHSHTVKNISLNTNICWVNACQIIMLTLAKVSSLCLSNCHRPKIVYFTALILFKATSPRHDWRRNIHCAHLIIQFLVLLMHSLVLIISPLTLFFYWNEGTN